LNIFPVLPPGTPLTFETVQAARNVFGHRAMLQLKGILNDQARFLGASRVHLVTERIPPAFPRAVDVTWEVPSGDI
jgi:hypothetical protein